MLESSAKIRTSPGLLDRLSRALMTTAQERATLSELAIPEITLGQAVRAASTAPDRGTIGTILDDLPPSLASATAGCSAGIEAAAHSPARARQRYHQAGTTGGLPTRSRVVASWHRCRQLGVDPDRKSAPIFAADTREVVGVVDVTGDYSLVRAHLLPIIMQAALDIEELLADRGFPV